MGHSYTGVGGIGDFDVEVTNPDGNIVRFTLEDDANKLTQIRLIQAVLKDAIQQWITENRAALDAAGDSSVVGADTRYPGDGFEHFVWNYGGKYGQITLTDTYGITLEDTITCSIPFGDVV